MNLEQKVMFSLTILSSLFVILMIIFQVGRAMEIESCITLPNYNSIIVAVFNQTDNTTQNLTYYLPSSSALEICPKKTSISFLNMSWGDTQIGASGNCIYNITVRNSSDLFPKRNYTFTLASNASYFVDDAFLTIDAKSQGFFCPICPEKKVCTVDYNFPGVANESLVYEQQNEECNVKVTMPPKPYCISDNSEWFANNTCVERNYFAELTQTANKYYDCNATTKIYQETWTAPSDVCRVAPKTLADAYSQMSSIERTFLPTFASLSGGVIKADYFASQVSSLATTPEQQKQYASMANYAIDRYRNLGLAEYWTENVTDEMGKPKMVILGYKSLVSPMCVNQSASLMYLSSEKFGEGRLNGLILAGVIVILLIFLMLWWIDINTPG